MESATAPQSPSWSRPRLGEKLRSIPLPRPELAALLVLAGVLYLWALGQNGWANEYYSAAVRSMAGSWHNFLHGSFDTGGLMTVDKPPLALWVQALSVKAFGFNSLAILVPQALMGMASVGLLYDLTRRRWGRQAGFAAGLVLALTPIAVAVSRHNNPDALVVLCCVGALWAFVRALEDGRTRWLVLAGACVGLGFEAKMGVALMVVPGIALAWIWIAPQGRLRAAKQLLAGGAALAAVALAWPLLVELTPGSDRPWVAGTTDNSVFSLILEYNGFGRLDGQAGGPGAFGGGGGGGPFGGETGPLRLLNEALGGQAGWLLGLSLVGGVGIARLSRLRREDERTGWIIAVGGAFAVTAVAFSFASGIFHPYYVSLLAPFAAALVGATYAQVRSGGHQGRVLGVAALSAGAIGSLIVIGNSAPELDWLVPVIVLGTAAAAIGLVADFAARWRGFAFGGGLAVLLIAPAIWSLQTLGHATSGTFPAGGPESASMGGGMGGPPGGGGAPSGGQMPGFGNGEGGMPGGGEMPMVPGTGSEMPLGPEGMGTMMPPGMGGGVPGELGGELPGGAAQQGAMPGGGPGGMFGGEDLNEVVAFAEANGGGMIAVASQSGASAAIIEEGAEVAGIGGFSGKETSVSVEWLEERIDAGAIAWILDSGGMGGVGPIGGDTRQGSEDAIATVTASRCTVADEDSTAGTLYHCA